MIDVFIESMRRVFRDLGESLKGHAARYALAAFAVAVGIMAFALLVLIVGGLQGRMTEITQEFGADVVSVAREEALDGRSRGLSVAHAELIRANYPAWQVAVLRRDNARTLGSNVPVNVIASDPGLAPIRGWKILKGRNFDSFDVSEKARVLVASRGLSEREGWETGRIVYLNDDPFFVAGVVDAQSVRLGNETLGSRFALLPWSTAASWRGERPDIGKRVEQILVQGDGAATATLTGVRRLLEQPDVDPGNVSWLTADHLIAGIERLQRTIGLSVGAIAFICLMLGGTTLMTLMVLNVRERIPEIGLRLTLGARRRQISALFVIEALIVTVASGAVGTALAHVLAGYLEARLPVEVEGGWGSVLAPTIMAMVIGTVFSWWPARMASRITPSEAIRAD